MLSTTLSAGPHGLGKHPFAILGLGFRHILFIGDPDDLSLRKVEKEILIPKKMRDVAREEKCVEEVRRFTECCKESSVLMVVSCRAENAGLKDCLGAWYADADFQERCKQLYLEERSEYRRTGIPRRMQRYPNSM